MTEQLNQLREALRRVKYEAASLADAQVIALEALTTSQPAQAGEVDERANAAAYMLRAEQTMKRRGDQVREQCERMLKDAREEAERIIAGAQPAAQATPEPLHLFEFWWESHMPQATQSQAWAAWTAAQNSKGATIDAAQATPEPDRDGDAFRTAARLGLTLRFYGGCAQSGMPGSPSAYEVVSAGGDPAAAMREAVERASAVIHAGGEAQKLATPEPVLFNGLTESETNATASVMGLTATPPQQAAGEPHQFPPLPEGWPARFRCDSCDGNEEIGELVSMGHFQPPERQPCPDCGGRGWTSEEPAFNAAHMQEFAEAHARSTHPAPGVPDGFALVPVEPTKEMIDRACADHGYPGGNRWIYRDGYKSMLAAAQAKGADPEDLAAAGVMLMGRRADHA